ncbi:MAG: hypothetical protein AB1478_05340 [Nitrospirota bacterium]
MYTPLTYLIDTNIFLEILLDQERAAECQELLERLQAKEFGDTIPEPKGQRLIFA